MLIKYAYIHRQSGKLKIKYEKEENTVRGEIRAFSQELGSDCYVHCKSYMPQVMGRGLTPSEKFACNCFVCRVACHRVIRRDDNEAWPLKKSCEIQLMWLIYPYKAIVKNANVYLSEYSIWNYIESYDCA